MPDFEAMTTDELVAFKADAKARIGAIRAEAREANAVYRTRVFEEHRQRAVEVMTRLAAESGRSLEEEARHWLGRLTDSGDPGHWIQADLVLGGPGTVLTRPGLENL